MSQGHPRRAAALALGMALLLPLRALAQPPANPDPSAQQASQAFAQALQALANAQWQEAEILLERTLLLQPEHAQAMLEMAQLLAQQGRPEGAQAFVQMLLQDARTPAPHRQRLQQLAQQLATPPAPAQPEPAAAHWAVELAAGYSSNPLATSDLSEITLTPSSGPVNLRLNTQPQSASHSALALQWQSGNGHLAALQVQRLVLQAARTGRRLLLQAPLPLAQSYWQILSQTQLDGAIRHQLSVGTQRPLWDLQLGWYQEPTAGRSGLHLRSRYTLHHSARWLLQTGLEAESNPAGASATPGMVRLQASASYAPAAPWQLQLHWSHQADTSGYSPLLANGAPRRMHTVQANAHYLLSAHWSLSAYAAQRQGNIPLFDWVDAGLRLSWVNRW